MPRWLSNDLRKQLELQKVPYYDIVDGPEALESRPQTRPHIVLQSDEQTGDVFSNAQGLGEEAARNMAMITIGMEALVFGRATKGGVVDHDEQCRCVARQLVVALAHVLQGYGIASLKLQPGRFLSREQLEERRLTQWPGRVYRLGFSWDEAVRDTDYKGDGADTVDGGDVTYETDYETEGAGGAELPSASTEVP